MQNGKNFIRTTDINTYKQLLECGFKEIPSSENGVYVFINDSKSLNFNKIDDSKISYTNVLCV